MAPSSFPDESAARFRAADSFFSAAGQKSMPRLAMAAVTLMLLPNGRSNAALAPTRAQCEAMLADARIKSDRLPTGSVARAFVDSDLVRAKSEAGNSEFDDCVELAQAALDEAAHPRHSTWPQAKPR